MYLGIDVGGTFTDGVLINKNQVIDSCKIPTNHNNLLQSFQKALDYLLSKNTDKKLTRIVVSTTLMTNLILEKKYKPTGLLLIPGPGLNINQFKFPFAVKKLKGAIDFQGRIIEEIDDNEVLLNIEDFIKEGISNIGIIGKFSPRNPSLENKVHDLIKNNYPMINIAKGHSITGNLNFIRRAMSAGLFLACQETFYDFVKALQIAVKKRSIKCPIYILKADGGIIPIEHASKFAVDTVLSGPAASCFGAKALLEENSAAIVMDIGGTTTDLSLILESQPLFASKGVKINELFTHVRSLALFSIPLGGDTTIEINNKQVVLTYKREGAPFCLGGLKPTVTDCLCVLGQAKIGDNEKAKQALHFLIQNTNYSIEAVAKEVLNLVCKAIRDAIETAFILWENEPAYRIWQVLNKRSLKQKNLISLGGPGYSIGEQVCELMNFNHLNFSLSSVANAIGAALAAPTYEEIIRINTEKGEVSSTWGFFAREDAFLRKKISKEEANLFAKKIFNLYLKKFDIFIEPQILQHEVFNMVRGWSTIGQIHEIQIGIPPQIIGLIKNRECINNAT